MLAVCGNAYQGKDESEESNNRGNFLEAVQLLQDSNEEFDEKCKDAAGNA